jgi:ankyrin repeat protein
VRYLISKGADVNVHASGGNTPLHVAAINPHADAEILRLLIANGADVNAKNGAGRTPLDFAAMNRNKSMIEEKQSIISAAMKQ